MINNLCRSFAQKTESQRKEIFCDMLLSPVMHTDCTNGRENGKAARYMSAQRRTEKPCILPVRKKGHEGVKDTVTEDYQGILVHDHDRTFYNYGTDHQECLAYVLRYLKGSMDNEPDRTWNKDMHSLVQEMIHFRNGLQPSEELDPCKVSEFEEDTVRYWRPPGRNMKMFRQTITIETGIIYF